ncbi:DUF6420 family protein [Streptomyces sp. NPDC003247]|uniref:DUF6420 family protein n=1 Tax=Streptomyces sp. NPDC003247 TaxID=3364677 RepID=UPI003692EFFC
MCQARGGGRLTVWSGGGHQRVTLDHLGCPAQVTGEKKPPSGGSPWRSTPAPAGRA